MFRINGPLGYVSGVLGDYFTHFGGPGKVAKQRDCFQQVAAPKVIPEMQAFPKCAKCPKSGGSGSRIANFTLSTPNPKGFLAPGDHDNYLNSEGPLVIPWSRRGLQLG